VSSLILILISFTGSWYLYEPESGNLITDTLCSVVLFVSFIALLLWVYKRISKSANNNNSNSNSNRGSSGFDIGSNSGDSSGSDGGCD